MLVIAPQAQLARWPIQKSLFCACGAAHTPKTSLCPRCHQRRADSKRRFNGLREDIVARDHHTCAACGTRPSRPHVHHRQPGCHDRRWLITLCPVCHARIHKLNQLPRCWVPPRLAQLWREQHPGAPHQLQFAFGEAA